MKTLKMHAWQEDDLDAAGITHQESHEAAHALTLLYFACVAYKKTRITDVRLIDAALRYFEATQFNAHHYAAISACRSIGQALTCVRCDSELPQIVMELKLPLKEFARHYRKTRFLRHFMQMIETPAAK